MFHVFRDFLSNFHSTNEFVGVGFSQADGEASKSTAYVDKVYLRRWGAICSGFCIQFREFLLPVGIVAERKF